MVYEGKGHGYSKRKKTKNRGRTLFLGLVWGFILVTALAVTFPRAAGAVRDKLASALKLDIDGAMAVFSREAKATNVFLATREAFRYAFDPDSREDLEALAGPKDPSGGGPSEGSAQGSQGGQGTLPGGSQGVQTGPGQSSIYSDPALFDDLPLPERVVLEKPRENLVLAGPLAGKVARPFGYTLGPEGEPQFHFGLDIRGEAGGGVRCVAEGTVEAVGESAVFGKYIIVAHADGVESLYALLGGTSVTEGESVTAGQTVGSLAGDLLHLELLVDGNYVNPQHYVYRVEDES